MTAINKITCPNCNHNFELKTAMISSLEKEITAKIRYKLEKENEEKSFQKDNKLLLALEENKNFKKENSLLKNELERKVDIRVKEITLEEESKYQAKLALKDKESKNKEDILLKKIDDLTRAANQTLPQRNGDVGEIFIKDTLETEFPQFEIESIKKGENGGDCILHYKRGTSHYKIKYESKKTKSFDKNWIKKLENDMKSRGCMYGFIVTTSMPNGQNHPFTIDGRIWVTPFHDFLKITQPIVESFFQIHKRDQANKTSDCDARKMLNHLVGPDFANQVNSQLKVNFEMREHLILEENAFKRSIARKKFINDRGYEAIMNMHEGLVSVIGDKMPNIEGLSDLKSIQ